MTAQHAKWRDVRDRRLQDSPALRDTYTAGRRALELGVALSRLREARGWSRAELAARMGTAPGFITRLEMGEVEPSLKTLNRLSRALGAELIIELREPAAVIA